MLVCLGTIYRKGDIEAMKKVQKRATKIRPGLKNLPYDTAGCQPVVSCKRGINITCHGAVLEQVDKFKYLGSIIDESATCSTEIRARLGAARSALRSLTTMWKDRTLGVQTKIKLLKTLVYGQSHCMAVNHGLSKQTTLTS